MDWNRIAIATCLAAPACALDSKSLGEESDTGSSEAGGSDDSGTDTGTEPLPPATEVSSQFIDDVTPSGISIAADGSIYVVGNSGYTYEGGDGGSYASLWIAKFDPAGTLLWNLEPGPSYGSIAAASDGCAVAKVGYTEGRGVQRYDGDGELLWSVELTDEPEDVIDQPEAIAIGPDGLVVVAGYHATGGNGLEGWAAAYDDTGAPQWDALYGDAATGKSAVQAVTFAPDGDIVLAGRHGLEPLSSRSQAWIAKVDTAGATQWEQSVTEGVGTDWITGVDVASDGTIHAIVWDGADRLVQAFDPSGTLLWSADATPISGTSGIAVASDGSYVLTDGEQLDFDDPNACEAPWGPCPSALRLARFDADRSVRWFDQRDDCNLGVAAGVLPDDRVIVAGACPPEIGTSTVAMGLFVYAP